MKMLWVVLAVMCIAGTASAEVTGDTGTFTYTKDCIVFSGDQTGILEASLSPDAVVRIHNTHLQQDKLHFLASDPVAWYAELENSEVGNRIVALDIWWVPVPDYRQSVRTEACLGYLEYPWLDSNELVLWSASKEEGLNNSGCLSGIIHQKTKITFLGEDMTIDDLQFLKNERFLGIAKVRTEGKGEGTKEYIDELTLCWIGSPVQ